MLIRLLTLAAVLAVVIPAFGQSSRRAKPPAIQPPGVNAAQAVSTIHKLHESSQRAKSVDDFTRLIELCEQSEEIELAPDQRKYARDLLGWALTRRGELRAEADEEESALADFELAVERSPDRWKARYNRGISHAVAGDLATSLADLNRAIELKRDYPRAWFNRGEVKFLQGDIQGAFRDYQEAIRLDPKLARARSSRGFLFYLGGQYEKALADFSETIRLDSTLLDAFIHRGDTFADVGRYREAAEDYLRAIQLSPRAHRPYLSWGWLMATCPDARYRNPQQALKYANYALRSLGEEHYRYLDVLAAAQANLGQYEEAVATEERVVELAPDNEKPVFRRRLEQYQEGKPLRITPVKMK